MKKVLVTVAALGLALGLASNALALDKPSRSTEVEATTAPRVPTATAPGVALWSVSGQYVLAGAYISDALGAGVAGSMPGQRVRANGRQHPTNYCTYCGGLLGCCGHYCGVVAPIVGVMITIVGTNVGLWILLWDNMCSNVD